MPRSPRPVGLVRKGQEGVSGEQGRKPEQGGDQPWKEGLLGKAGAMDFLLDCLGQQPREGEPN